MSDLLTPEQRARVEELAAKVAKLDAEYLDVPNGTRGAIYGEALLESLRRSYGKWPTCEQFAHVSHEIYHLSSDARHERLEKN